MMRPIKPIPLNIEPPSENQSKGFVFHVISPNHVRTLLQFDQFPITVGRSVGNDITIDDEAMDGLHLKILRDQDDLVVESFGKPFKANGQKVQRYCVTRAEKVKIEVGSSQVLVSFSEVEGIGSRGGQVTGNRTLFELDDDKTRVNSQNRDEYTISGYIGSGEYSQDALNFYRRLSLMPEASEIARTLLGKAAELAQSVSSSALYLWQKESRSLKCFAATNFLEKDRDGVDRELFLHLKRTCRPIKLHSSAAALKEPSQTRLVVPIMLDVEVFGFAYLRISRSPGDVSDVAIAQIFDVLRLAAPLLANALMQKQMDSWVQGMVETVLATIGAKDTYTVGHSERVCRFSVILARIMGLSGEELNRLMFSSLIHDIGKVGIPDAILKKADLLSAEEFDIMRQHPIIGGNIIANLPMADQILGGVKYHHERWDGTGYPEGLEGENIPLFGRIIAVTDAFDAMTSGRSYSGYMSVDEAITRLSEINDLFDPEVLKAFVTAYERGDLTIRTGTALNEGGPATFSPLLRTS